MIKRGKNAQYIDELIEEVISLYNKGYSGNDIATLMDIPAGTIYGWIKKAKMEGWIDPELNYHW